MMSIPQDTYKTIAEKMRAADRFLIFPHINPDGDALGSTAALCLGLRQLGKEAYILVDGPYPHNLDFLECGCSTTDVNIFDGKKYTAVMVDCSGRSRVGDRYPAYEKAPMKAVLDHHGVTEGDIESDYGRIEPDSAACGEIIYMLLKELGVEINLEIANCIFAAITTDTGNFQHNNTSRRSHLIAADLYDIEGFNSKPISVLIYNRNSAASMKLESIVMEGAETFESGSIMISRVTQQMLADTGCTMDDAERFVQKLMSVDGVEIGVLLKEVETGITKVSLRARSYSDVASVAKQFGGGGHIKAAGCTIECSPEKAEKKILPALIQAINNK